MATLQALVYVFSCGLLPWLAAGQTGRRPWRWPERLAIGLVLFYSAMLVPGAVGVVSGQSLVRFGLAASLAATLALALGLAIRVGTLRPPSMPDLASEPLRWVPLVALVSVFSAGLLLAGLLWFDFPRGYEPRAYHLPIAINIARSGSIEPWDLAFMHMYPGNQSLFGAFLLSWLPERALSSANILSLGLCAAVTYALSRQVGGDRSAAVLVAAGICTIPVFGFSALEFGADLGGAALLGLAAYFVLGGGKQGPTQAALAGLVAGLAFGFKSLHLIPVALLGVLILLQAPANRRGAGRVTSRVVIASVYALACIVTAGPWLIRNYLAVGNPLYPVHIAPVFDWFGWSAAPDFNLADRTGRQLEWVDSSRGWLVYPWVEGHRIGENYKHSSGLGAFFAAAVAPALVIGTRELATTIRGWSLASHESIVRASLTALTLAILLAWWLLGDRQPRYFMGAIMLVAPIAASLLSGLVGAARRVLECLWLACILLMLVLIVGRVGAEVGGRLLQSREVVRYEVLEYVPAVDGLPASSVILNCVRRPMNYALFGDRLENRVVSYSTARARFAEGSGDRWRFTSGALRELGITHIYLDSRLAWGTGENVRLVPVGQLRRNPYNGQLLPATYTLYSVDLSQSGAVQPDSMSQGSNASDDG